MKVLKILIIFSVFLIFSFSVISMVNNIVRDERASSELSHIATQYKNPEYISDNAFIDLIAIQRSKEQSIDDIRKIIAKARRNYDIFSPISTTPDKQYSIQKIKFYGVSWVYNCWLTPVPADGACIQPHAFERTSIERNKLLLERYEHALSKDVFISDGFLGFSDDVLGLSYLYMATTSFRFYQQNYEEATRMWTLQHDALYRFIENGYYSLDTIGQLLNLYQTSLLVAEKMLLNGLPPQYWNELHIRMDTPITANNVINHFRVSEVGYIHDQLRRYFFPIPYGLNYSRVLNSIVPALINKNFNALLSETSAKPVFTEGYEVIYNTVYEKLNAKTALRNKIDYSNAYKRALSLGLNLKKNDILQQDFSSWISKQLIPPYIPEKTTYLFNETFGCIEFTDIEDKKSCVFVPRYIPQTNISLD